MAQSHPIVAPSSGRQNVAVLSGLLLVAAAAWTVFFIQAGGGAMEMSSDAGTMPGMSMPMSGSDVGRSPPAPDLSMGGAALPFLGSWIAMMAAMMLPAAAPMILLYARTQRGHPARTALFTGSYLVLWGGLGLVAFVVAVGLERAIESGGFGANHWGRAVGLLLVAAGVYQASAWKEACLRQCRSPLAFIFTAWRDGASGALRMGFRHGLYCAGCCWLLFLVLVPIGVMHVPSMLLVAGAVFSEKVLPWPDHSRRLIAAALVAYGALVVVEPAMLPSVV